MPLTKQALAALRRQRKRARERWGREVYATDYVFAHLLKCLLNRDMRTILRIVDFPPDTEYDTEAMANFLATIVPEKGRQPANDRHFFFHTTQTLDYAIVLGGEIWAMMDEDETLMQRGDVLIQRATSHSWSNRTNRDCKMAFVLIDGARISEQ